MDVTYSIGFSGPNSLYSGQFYPLLLGAANLSTPNDYTTERTR